MILFYIFQPSLHIYIYIYIYRERERVHKERTKYNNLQHPHLTHDPTIIVLFDDNIHFDSTVPNKQHQHTAVIYRNHPSLKMKYLKTSIERHMLYPQLYPKRLSNKKTC